MNIFNFIRNKEVAEYKDINSLIRNRMRQVKDMQIMREANSDLAKLKPAKTITSCLLCGEAKIFFKAEALKICKECWRETEN